MRRVKEEQNEKIKINYLPPIFILSNGIQTLVDLIWHIPDNRGTKK